jgi:HD-GYP domain-containing protein (c-di-GMP phosphodiesterase class II)/DNA-binding CsgD family transcriptional regulator
VRLAEIVGSLSLATDLGNGLPLENALSVSLVGIALAKAHGLRGKELDAVFWGGLLRFVGCISTSVEESSFGGDDLDLRAVLVPSDFFDGEDLKRRLETNLAKNQPPDRRASIVKDFMTRGPQIAGVVLTSHCEVAVRLARRLGMSEAVTRALDAYHERWDGLGPRGLAEESIPIAARILTLAQVAVAVGRVQPIDELRSTIERRSGRMLDPSVAETFLREDRALLAGIGRESVWDRVMDLEPGPKKSVSVEGFRDIARVLGDYSDLKSPYTLGHTQGVARLATRAAEVLGLKARDLLEIEQAALLHDLGRASVPSGIWDKPGPLNRIERDRVKHHAYETERILAAAPALSSIARLAASEHERADGSGYPRGVTGASLGASARVLIAADAYHGMLEDRAYRRGYSAARAAKVLRESAEEGLFDPRAVAAVLEAAGQKKHDRGATGWPAGLTDREVEVLRLIARGLTNKEVGAELGISSRTVQQHTINLYGKIGVSTRAAATLFATEHDLFAVWC